LVAVRINRAAAMLGLDFLLPGGPTVAFSFAGVIHLRIAETLLQNVVYRVFVLPGDALQREEIRRILTWMFSLDGKLAIADSFLETHVADVLAGDRVLFYAEPSWGAEIGVLCASVACSEPRRPQD
jgi:hypothetical protein